MFSYRFESELQHGDAGLPMRVLLTCLAVHKSRRQWGGFYISFTLTEHTSSARSIPFRKGPVRINAAPFL
jgi:hypothetical protein